MAYEIQYSPQLAAEKLTGLLKEYTAKLQQMRERAFAYQLDRRKGIPRDYEVQAWQMERIRLADPLGELARHTSQIIEHAGIDETTRVELRIRLAELELAMQSLHQVGL